MMAAKDFEQPGDAPGEDDVPQANEGAESGSAPSAPGEAPAGDASGDESLTVDDILDAEQTDDATAADKSDYETQLLGDLKRIQAEYANYRRRTEGQREIEIARARGEAAKGLLPVLDDLDRAEKHGDLADGTPFAAVGAKLRAVVERLGITAYGEPGEVFDPQRHEAIFQQPTPGATESTVLEVVEVGYRIGDAELRPAKVVVAVPAD